MLLAAVFAASEAALGAEAGASLSTGAKRAARLAYTASAMMDTNRVQAKQNGRIEKAILGLVLQPQNTFSSIRPPTHRRGGVSLETRA